MSRQPRNRYQLPHYWRELVDYYDVDKQKILSLANMPENLFEKSTVGISALEFVRLWNAFYDFLNDPLLPIKVCKAIFTEVFEVSIFAGLCCENGKQGLTQLARFKPLISPITFELTENGDSATVSPINVFEGSLDLPDSLILLDLVFPVEMLRLATESMIVPLKVELKELNRTTPFFHKYFGCDIVEGERNGVTFKRDDIYIPFKTSNQIMWQRFEQSLDHRLKQLDQFSPYTSRVKNKLLETLPAGNCTVESVAEQLHIGTRSLQRRLRAEHSSFRKILKDTRSELAIHYMKNSNLKDYEISFLLGFEDQNSFFRAFQQWLGTTPDSFRDTFARI